MKKDDTHTKLHVVEKLCAVIGFVPEYYAYSQPTHEMVVKLNFKTNLCGKGKKYVKKRKTLYLFKHRKCTLIFKIKIKDIITSNHNKHLHEGPWSLTKGLKLGNQSENGTDIRKNPLTLVTLVLLSLLRWST